MWGGAKWGEGKSRGEGRVSCFGLERKKKKNRIYSLNAKCMFLRCLYLPCLYPCTLPTAPVSSSFGLRSSYEIDILDTDQRPRNKSRLLLNQ